MPITYKSIIPFSFNFSVYRIYKINMPNGTVGYVFFCCCSLSSEKVRQLNDLKEFTERGGNENAAEVVSSTRFNASELIIHIHIGEWK